MTPSTTGLLCEPNSKFKYVSPDDTPAQGVLARWKREREQDTTAAQRGFFNALPHHIKGLATYRNNHSKGLEA